MTEWKKYIESNPVKLCGKPVVMNTRIPVDLVLEKLGTGDTHEDLLQAYPQLTKEAIFACLIFAAESIKNEVFVERAS